MAFRAKRMLEMVLAECRNKSVEEINSNQLRLDVVRNNNLDRNNKTDCAPISIPENCRPTNQAQFNMFEDPEKVPVRSPITNDGLANSSNAVSYPENRVYVLEADDRELLDLIQMSDIPVLDSSNEINEVIVTVPEQTVNNCNNSSTTAHSPLAADIAGPLMELEESREEQNSATDTNISVITANPDASDMPSDTEFHPAPRDTSLKLKRGNSKCWSKNLNKRLRMEGKRYIGYRIKENKVVQDQPRNERKLGDRCNSESCRKYTERKCDAISEEERNDIFQEFWSKMSWEQRKVFVANNVKKIVPKRRYTSKEESRRSVTFLYYLKLKNGTQEPVCKNMFLSTLGLGERSVREWVKKSSAGMCASDEVSVKNRKSDRPAAHKEQLEHLNKFLDDLPKLPSHYNRSNTSKLFLEQSIDSLAQLYDLYCENMQHDNGTPVSRTKFSSVFHEKNLSLHKLKKDQCDMCAEHEAGNLSEEDWIQHKIRKDRARKEKEDDKTLAAQKQCTVIAMDLQAVKVAPCIQASAFYYKTKLTCHNFTVFNLTTHHCVCYWFSEIDTDLSASTFATMIIDYLKCHCANDKEIIIYSDGCTYQNRNSILANALLDHAIKNGQTIIQKFLERGHTQMECDSVHSTIERKLKKRPIHLPSNYITITQEARKKPFPYEAKWLNFDAFADYSQKPLHRFLSIRPGQRKVTDIRCLKYSPNGDIEYKVNFDEDWQLLPQRRKEVKTPVQWPSLHSAPRKISSQKYHHLQQLKSLLPKDCHAFYDSLPHD